MIIYKNLNVSRISRLVFVSRAQIGKKIKINEQQDLFFTILVTRANDELFLFKHTTCLSSSCENNSQHVSAEM